MIDYIYLNHKYIIKYIIITKRPKCMIIKYVTSYNVDNLYNM